MVAEADQLTETALLTVKVSFCYWNQILCPKPAELAAAVLELAVCRDQGREKETDKRDATLGPVCCEPSHVTTHTMTLPWQGNLGRCALELITCTGILCSESPAIALETVDSCRQTHLQVLPLLSFELYHT